MKSNDTNYTIDDIIALPEGQRAEIIDGVWYDMATPRTIHQWISSNLFYELFNHIRSKDGKCRVFHPPFAVYLKDDGRNWVEPDIMVVCNPDIIEDDGIHGAPDLVIEIVSKSSQNLDYGKKLEIYRRYGVKEYWIVMPNSLKILVY